MAVSNLAIDGLEAIADGGDLLIAAAPRRIDGDDGPDPVELASPSGPAMPDDLAPTILAGVLPPDA